MPLDQALSIKAQLKAFADQLDELSGTHAALPGLDAIEHAINEELAARDQRLDALEKRVNDLVAEIG